MKPRILRCALLSSFTLDQLPLLAEGRLARDQVQSRWYIGPFGQYSQLILNEDSELYSFDPDIVFLAIAIEDLYHDLASICSGAQRWAAISQQRMEELTMFVQQVAARLPSSTIFVHSFIPLVPSPHVLLDHKVSARLGSIALRGNLYLAELSQKIPNVFVTDLAQVFREMPMSEVYDPRFYYLARMRFSRLALDRLVEQYHRVLLARVGRRRKCIVVDLDNTLWGGIVGEEGPEHLALGEDGIGRAYRDVQHVLLELYESGVLLAVCSKNDEDLALSVIREHPGMVLRPHHFAAMRINWLDKPTNLHAIADELNLGLDSLVFVDDSSFEREQVRQTLPEVAVVDLPSDCAYFASVLAQLSLFDTLTITEEDLRRGQMYFEDRRRRDLQTRAISLQAFLRELNLQVSVDRADRFSLPRIAQLTQRTNQFNLTTRRYTESDLLRLLQDGVWRVYCIQAQDRVGESGIVGAAIVRLDRPRTTACLDTFLLSCRVLGRGIESAFLAGVLTDAERTGMHSIEAEFVPTKRNEVAKGFLERHGFWFEDGLWRRRLTDGCSVCPDWISLKVGEG